MDVHAAVSWIQAHTKQPREDGASLCAYLRDGRVLCMLANALSGTNDVRVRSPDRFRTYHALESVSLFLRWARDRAQIGDAAMFTSAQLIDEQDEHAVLVCIDALHAKYGTEPMKPISTDDASVVPTPTKLTPLATSIAPTTTTSPAAVVTPSSSSVPSKQVSSSSSSSSPVKPASSSPKRRLSPKSNQLIADAPQATTDSVDTRSSIPPPVQTPRAPSPAAPVSSVPPAVLTVTPPLVKSTSKLANFVAASAAFRTTPTLIRQPSSRSDEATTRDAVASEPPAVAAPPTTPSPPRNKIASAYLAAIDAQPATTAAATISPSKPSPLPAASLESPPPSRSSSGNASPLRQRSNVASVYLSALQDEDAVVAPVTTSTETEWSVVPCQPTPASDKLEPIVLTLPAFDHGFSLGWSHATSTVAILVHGAPLWPHLALVSINGIAVASGEAPLSLATWTRLLEATAGPFTCQYVSPQVTEV
ncbi:Aste57867_22257 [Aphanomyces stellatus]|uniref:Aste57867_22257 protein n=1 Tax=Aphanomyces stellatus TaxID=120398 RepID=A0A485LL12_9STRA|nr:hypothetical protein As57867_022187 [Aphanomyces stellatus]VFT98924.1 Aste57867_22257 [Aphanomyces stellatus]